MLNRMRIRYAPNISTTAADGRSRRQSGDVAVVQGRLFPREDEQLGADAFTELRRVLPRAHAITSAVPLRSNVLATLVDGLIVLDDIEPVEETPYNLAPLQVDKGRPGASLAHWMQLPWGAPEGVALPGFHTPAENALKRLGTSTRGGDELFLTSMAMLASGSRTVLISRWRTGGQTTYNLIREFWQEWPNTTAADAWQRSVQIAQESPLDVAREPRVQNTDAASGLTAKHPFFWSGYLLVDAGATDGAVNEGPQARPKLEFPGGNKAP